MKRAVLTLCVFVGLSACKKKEEAPVELASDTTEQTAAPTPPPVPSEPSVELDSIPTEEEFEEEAEQGLTADNLEAKLDEIEEEIGGQ